MKTIEQLLEDLAKNGGAIVCSASCHENEIAQARACGHFAVRDDGIGFVHRSNEWLALVDSRITDDPEDRALDALIVAAMRGIDPEEIKKAVDNG